MSQPEHHITIIALGANLSGPKGEMPKETLQNVIQKIHGADLQVLKHSPCFESPPWPPTPKINDQEAQPAYINAVILAKCTFSAPKLLAHLHTIEAAYGRNRALEGRNGARALDLDVIAFNDEVWDGNVIIPHPRMHLRRFVLEPLLHVWPDWRHPVLHKTVTELIDELPTTEPPITEVK